MRIIKPFALVATLALALAACTAGAPSTDAEAPVGSNRPAETAPVETPAPEEPSETPAAPANPKFGETYVWEDGVSVTIGAPELFTPGQYAAGGDGFPAAVKFNVTIVNGGTANFDPAGFFATMQSGNTEGDRIFDDQLSEPSTTILPGREAAFVIGFGVQNPDDLVMEVTPGMWDYDDAIFTS